MTNTAISTRTETARPFQGFRGDIGGLRGVAVLLVLVSHLSVGFENGFIGVDIFFVISGFLITGLMLKEYSRTISEGHGRISLAGFYARRARRILPAAVLCLVLTVIAANVVLNAGAAAEVEKDALWALLFAANIDMINSSTDYFQQGFQVSPLQNFWSLAVEEQFYIVWPSLVVLVLAIHGLRVARRQVRWNTRVLLLVGIVTVASLAWSIVASVTEPEVAYFSTLTRAWELGIGAAAATILFQAQRSLHLAWGVVGAIAVTGTLIFMPSGMPFPGWVALIPVVGTALVLASGVTRRGPVFAALNVAPLRFFGEISYSLYLFHWPIIVLFSRFMPDWNMWVRALVLAAASIAIGTVSYYLVEKPTLKYLPKFRFEQPNSKPTSAVPRTATLAACAAIGVAALLVFVPPAFNQTAYAKGMILEEQARNYTPPEDPASDTPPAIPTLEELTVLSTALRASVDAAANQTTVPASLTPSLIKLGESKGAQTDLCTDGDCTTGNGSLRALLIGNSYADMVYPMVEGALPGTKWTLDVRWQSGCQLAVASECPQIFNVSADDIDLLIISDAAYLRAGLDQRTRDAQIADELAKYAAQVPHVVYLGQVPGMEKALVDCVDAAGGFGDDCYSDRHAVDEINAVKLAASANSGATFVNPTEWICSGEVCPIVIGDWPTYVDTEHLSSNLAAALAPDLRLRLLPLIEPIEGSN